VTATGFQTVFLMERPEIFSFKLSGLKISDLTILAVNRKCKLFAQW